MSIGDNKDRHGMRVVRPEDVPVSSPDFSLEEQLEDLKRKLAESETKRKVSDAKLKEANATILELQRDPVTKLFTFNMLEARLNDSIEKLNHPTKKEGENQRPPIYAVVVMALDLDNLKKWNEYGHPVGDKALEKLAISLRDATKAEDHIFRRGDRSDEIVIVMEIDKDLSDEFIQKQIFGRIENVVNTTIPLEARNGEIEPVTASIECVIVRPGGLQNVSEILSIVDAKQVADKNDPEKKQERINKARKALGLPLIFEDYSI